MSSLLRMALFAVALAPSALWGRSGVIVDRVTLWVESPTEIALGTSQQLERELQSIVEPAGVRLSWQRLPAEAGSVVEGVSIVVRLRGACSPGSPHAGTRSTSSAGWAHTSDGNILPFIEVDCDRIWSVIEAELQGKVGVQREIQLGRAVGRVMAHELRHVLANTATHGSEGLTKARLSSRDLINGSFSLTEADITRQIRISDSSTPMRAAPDAQRAPVRGGGAPSAGGSSSRSSLPEKSSATGR